MTDATFDKDRIDSFVVRNTHYYRDKWQKMAAAPGPVSSFNWAAAFCQIFWLAYRKLYGPFWWALMAYIAYVAAWLYIDDKLTISTNLSATVNWAVAVLFFVAFGLLGNSLYWRRYRKIERQAALRHADDDSQHGFLRSKGGTSPLAASAIVIVFLLPVIWALYWGVYKASELDFSQFVFDASGPLTLHEIQSNYLVFMDEPLEGKRKECVFIEIQKGASAAGDPESLDPETVEFLPVENWHRLGQDGRRIILTQAILTQAFFNCDR